MLNVQKRLAAQLLKCGENRVRLDPDSLDEIKEAITKSDLRGLISRGIITKKRTNSTSKFWARHRKNQKIKGKQKGPGSRKGKKTARHAPKQAWMNKVRLQRRFLKSLRGGEKITTKDYHGLYMKIKGGFFRSIRHLKLYTQEKNILKK
jgi:large subunit ribosomal protein L19e